MKKIAIILLCVLGLFLITAAGAVDFHKGNPKKTISTNLYSDNGYIDYADTVFLDTETYPDMQEMGLFWTRWDELTQSIVQIPADSAEGAALVDPNKPTIINVHGVLLDGYAKQEAFNLNNKIANPAEFDLDTESVSMNFLWIKAGWNVANFHYNRFASELFPWFIEGKIWAQKSDVGMRYRHANEKYSDDVTEYCLAEHFAAEYIRAMRLLPESMGTEEIRVAGHSMGGMLSTASIFLLTELADAGQLPTSQLPNRFAMLDPYFSTTLETNGKTLYLGPLDIVINWSNKPIVKNNTGLTMIECLKALDEKGIALEYYTYEKSLLKAGMLSLVEELKTLATYSIVLPDFQGEGYSVMSDGHNGVREWYLCSILAPATSDITNGDNSTVLAPSAAMDTAELKNYRNTEYVHIGGTTTVSANDDKFAQKNYIYYDLNGGKNSTTNIDYFLINQPTLVLNAPFKKGYDFDGWYLSEDFSGNNIVSIPTNTNKDYTLYAKWVSQ